MKRILVALIGAAAVFSLTVGAEAFTSKQARSVSVTASGVTDTSVLQPLQVVQQGTADVAGTLTFGVGGNNFRDSGVALKVDGASNAAANRLIIYTNNLSATASPQAALDTGLGNDGGGLVGVTDRSKIVPLLWVIKDTNVDHVFTSATIGDDEIYITDRAHVATYVDAVLAGASAAEKQKLDTLAMKRCDDGTAVPNPDNAGTALDPERYPQFFGSPGIVNSDLCSASAVAVTINGTTINPNAEIPFAKELSKNIAVVAFNCIGTACTAPDLSTPSPLDTISVTLPVYLPIGGDFRTAPAQDYATSTLTVDLVTQ